LPLGCTKLIKPTVMKNILGEEGENGKAVVTGADKVLAIAGAKLHIYGKAETVPKRKMGHITVTADTLDEAVKLANQAHLDLKIKGGK